MTTNWRWMNFTGNTAQIWAGWASGSHIYNRHHLLHRFMEYASACTNEQMMVIQAWCGLTYVIIISGLASHSKCTLPCTLSIFGYRLTVILRSCLSCPGFDHHACRRDPCPWRPQCPHSTPHHSRVGQVLQAAVWWVLHAVVDWCHSLLLGIWNPGCLWRWTCQR